MAGGNKSLPGRKSRPKDQARLSNEIHQPSKPTLYKFSIPAFRIFIETESHLVFPSSKHGKFTVSLFLYLYSSCIGLCSTATSLFSPSSSTKGTSGTKRKAYQNKKKLKGLFMSFSDSKIPLPGRNRTLARPSSP